MGRGGGGGSALQAGESGWRANLHATAEICHLEGIVGDTLEALDGSVERQRPHD